MCFHLPASLPLKGARTSEVQLSLHQLNARSFHRLSLHYIMQPGPYAPLMITRGKFLTHPPCFEWGVQLEDLLANSVGKNDYFWMWFCFRRYYSYHQETGWKRRGVGGGRADAALDAILQILDILSHLLWERWDELL